MGLGWGVGQITTSSALLLQQPQSKPLRGLAAFPVHHLYVLYSFQSPFILTVALNQQGQHCFLHATDAGSEAQRGKVTC